jgi:hypothetical protein
VTASIDRPFADCQSNCLRPSLVTASIDRPFADCQSNRLRPFLVTATIDRPSYQTDRQFNHL